MDGLVPGWRISITSSLVSIVHESFSLGVESPIFGCNVTFCVPYWVSSANTTVLSELVELGVLLHYSLVVLFFSFLKLAFIFLLFKHLLLEDGTELLLFHLFHLKFFKIIKVWLLRSHRSLRLCILLWSMGLKFVLLCLVTQTDSILVKVQLHFIVTYVVHREAGSVISTPFLTFFV